MAERVAAGTLTELPGIGKSTGAVITQALAGEVPQRIVELEATTEVPLSEAGRPYREALRGDCHAHSFWSDGGATIESMARTADGARPRLPGHDRPLARGSPSPTASRPSACASS